MLTTGCPRRPSRATTLIDRKSSRRRPSGFRDDETAKFSVCDPCPEPSACPLPRSGLVRVPSMRKDPNGESPLRNQVAGISSKPQGAGREAEAERSGARKLRVDVQKPDLRRCILGRAGGQPRSSRDQRGVAYIRRPCSEGPFPYLGRSRLVPERATPSRRSEKSAEAVVAEQKPEG
jgi:hypothetical protein